MKFIHSADWHLGRMLHEQSLQEEQKKFLDWFVHTCEESAPEMVVLAGDIFDRSIPSEDAIALWTGFLVNFHHTCPGIPLVVIPGNHDNPTRLSFASGVLKSSGIHVIGTFKQSIEPLEFSSIQGEKVQIWALPFLWPGALDRPSPLGPVPTGTQEESLLEALSHITALQDSEALQILGAHCFTRGGRVSESERTLVGTATQIDAEAFSAFDYTALGHLHKPQMVTPRMWYAGSPLAYSFSESTDKKCLLEITLSKGLEPQIRVIPVPVTRPVTVLRGSLTEILTDLRFREHQNSYLRVETTDTGGLTQPFHRLREVFPFILSYEFFENQAVHPEISRHSMEPMRWELKKDIKEDFSDFLQDLSLSQEEIISFEKSFSTLATRLIPEEQ